MFGKMEVCGICVSMVALSAVNHLDAAVNKAESARAVDALKVYLSTPSAQRKTISEQPFSKVPITKQHSAQAANLLWADHAKRIRVERDKEMEDRVITLDDLKMRFIYKIYGDKPKNGRSLYISLHGGGGVPARANNSEWQNQKVLYQPEEGIYLVPRAPTDTWNLWHQKHIDPMLRRLIENLIVFEDVDPNRVYLNGYSAGGDGVYQLAPRMADSFAAASMMAGHPNETKPVGLRNLPFSLHVGEKDSSYNRNKVAAEWKAQLAQLAADDPKGYVHWAKLYEGKAHWMGGEDAAALPWMAKFTRNRYPDRIVWRQDDVTHNRFYWLAVIDDQKHNEFEVIARYDGQRFDIDKSDPTSLKILMNDEFVDLDQPVSVFVLGQERFSGRAARKIEVLARTLEERGDPTYMFSAEITVSK